MSQATVAPSLRLTIKEGLAELVFDAQQRNINSIDAAMMQQMELLLSQLEQQPEVQALVLYSAKPDHFVVGADLAMLQKIHSATEAQALSEAGHRLIQRLHDLPIPVVVAIHGRCVGGGLELSLACSARLCSNDPLTQLGLPEVTLGLIPGAGGTQRLPRQVGLAAALDMILSGRMVGADEALAMGLVDACVPPETLLLAARQHARALVEATSTPLGFADKLKDWTGLGRVGKQVIDDAPLARGVLLNRAREKIQAESHGLYPAPFAALRVIEAGLEQGLVAGLRAEAQAYGELVVSKVSNNLRRLFFLQRAAQHSPVQKKPDTLTAPRFVAVCASADVADNLVVKAAHAGARVRLQLCQTTDLGPRYQALQRRCSQAVLATARDIDVQRLAAKITLSVDGSGQGHSQIAVEMSRGPLAAKQQALAELSAQTATDTVLLSGHRYFSLADLAQSCPNPQRVLLAHFLPNARDPKCVELVKTAATDTQALQFARRWLQGMGWPVVVVNDGLGYFATRSIMAVALEALRLLGEGAAVDAVDRVMRAFGMAQGPLQILDNMGLEQVFDVVNALKKDLQGEPDDDPGALWELVPSLLALRNDGRFGKKNKRGFYRYDGAQQGSVDTTVYDLLPGGQRRRPIDEAILRQRMVLAWVNQSQQCLDQAVIADADDGDLLAVLGLGFPAYLGGPLAYAQQRGRERISDELNMLSATQGSRFQPAAGFAHQG